MADLRPDPRYEAETQGIRVRVRPRYLADQSEPGRWVWAYRVEIENRGEETVQLVARRWIITDAQGKVEEVAGPGVVGETPVLGPGQRFAYSSGCPLATASGSMHGAYQMKDAKGRAFEVEIPAFVLETPGQRRVLN